MIWAYHSSDPASLRSLGSLRHERMGSISLNLIGGSSEERTEQNSDFFIIKNENVSCKNISEFCNIVPHSYQVWLSTSRVLAMYDNSITVLALLLQKLN